MKMRSLSAAAILSALVAAPALATSQGGNQFPKPMPGMTPDTMQVRAGEILQEKDLSRRQLDASDTLTLTTVPSAGPVDFSSANGG